MRALSTLLFALAVIVATGCSGDAECPAGSSRIDGYCQMDDPAATADFQRPSPLDSTHTADDVTQIPEILPETTSPPDIAVQDNLNEKSDSD